VSLIVVALLLVMALLSRTLWAEPVSSEQARRVTQGWLRLNPRPLGVQLGRLCERLQIFSDNQGQPLYYVLYLQGGGFVVVSGDDEVEPIIAFAAAGRYEPSDDNPLDALVRRDIPARIAAVRNGQLRSRLDNRRLSVRENRRQKSKARWHRLQNYATRALAPGQQTTAPGGYDVEQVYSPAVSDIRISPLVVSQWNQASVCGDYCYDYYTPNHYVCGCLATAMAQLIRYHTYPTIGIGTTSFNIEVDGESQIRRTRGGDEIGGPYDYDQMPLEPDCGLTEAQRQAIGALCHDTGVAISTSYTDDGSAASMDDGRDALVQTFGFANAVLGYNDGNHLGAVLSDMINTNLDAGLPVVLGAFSDTAGHAVVCDGYGFNGETGYHHLNMGWGGYKDTWYNLPDVVDYHTVVAVVYNVLPTGSGQIISGRVTSPGQIPVPDAGVTARDHHGTIYATDTTDSRGIYALTKLPATTTFTVTVSKPPLQFIARSVTTGSSLDFEPVCGNRWAVDFISNFYRGAVELDSETYLPGQPLIVTLTDSDLQACGSATARLTTSSADVETVSLYEDPPDSGRFTGTMATAGEWPVNQDQILQFWAGDTVTVTYHDADDGTGQPATATDTATAAGVFYQADFEQGLPGGWTICDGQNDNYTWTTDNAGGKTSDYWSGLFFIVDSDWARIVDMDEQLITEAIDCSAYSNIILKFDHEFFYWYRGKDEICDVDYRLGDGAWQNLARYQLQSTAGPVELALPSAADGRANLQIRWRYYNAYYEGFWGIDNVRLVAGNLLEPVAGDFQPDGQVDLHDLAILTAAYLSSPADSDWNRLCDLAQPRDEYINQADLAVFAENWLSSRRP